MLSKAKLCFYRIPALPQFIFRAAVFRLWCQQGLGRHPGAGASAPFVPEELDFYPFVIMRFYKVRPLFEQFVSWHN